MKQGETDHESLEKDGRLYTLPRMEAVVLVSAVVVFAAATAVAIRERRASQRSHRASEDIQRSAEVARDRASALLEERQAMQTALSSMEEGVILVGPEGRVELANPAAERHLGTRPSSLSAVFPLGVREAANEAVRVERAALVEVETGAPSRWLRVSAIPVGGGSVLLVIRDVTEAKRLEAVRRDFVANASHELKTPAASIQAAAETIGTAAHEDPTVIPRFAGQLEREAVRLSHIVSDLLDLSRLETGSELDASVEMDELLREEERRLREAANEANVNLDMRAGSVPPVRGSARDLALLIHNLVDNAIRYTKPGGRVDVTISVQGDEVVLSVTDTGVGIPTRELPRIFERFYRVDRARSRETGGTGLGLSIVKHVVENHGGTVSVRSELGRGTCFEVRLPAAVT